MSETGSELILLVCGDSTCSQRTPRTLVSGLSPSDRQPTPSIIVRETGFPLITFFDASTEAIVLIDCNDTACSGDDETLRFIGSSDEGHTSLAMGLHGYPVLAYDGTSGTDAVSFSILAIE